ncbi:hypothetical protein [Arthrobacter sp. U41]|uniref:hypothetical protein n=1 Tax=Arthrobacter sp. U41 TaxID=1849032 RepID=UPI0012FAD429|nr:hypothetical protein [Arthrobacter sp. U41]
MTALPSVIPVAHGRDRVSGSYGELTAIFPEVRFLAVQGWLPDFVDFCMWVHQISADRRQPWWGFHGHRLSFLFPYLLLAAGRARLWRALGRREPVQSLD